MAERVIPQWTLVDGSETFPDFTESTRRAADRQIKAIGTPDVNGQVFQYDVEISPTRVGGIPVFTRFDFTGMRPVDILMIVYDMLNEYIKVNGESPGRFSGDYHPNAYHNLQDAIYALLYTERQ
jgi:hypothetical protein